MRANAKLSDRCRRKSTIRIIMHVRDGTSICGCQRCWARVYPALDTPTDCVRLVRLFRSGNLSFEVHRLNELPNYTALSYAWHEVTDELGPFFLDAFHMGRCARVAVQYNLWSFIQYEKARIQTFDVYWIDAICINQVDIEERNSQVSIMGEIYSKARLVKVWLGHNSGSVILDDWMSCIEGTDTSEGSLTLGRHYAKFEMPAHISEYQLIATLNVLHIIQQRQYWKRMWVIQEFLLAKDIEFCFGGMCIPFFEFLDTFCQQVSDHRKAWTSETKHFCFLSAVPALSRMFHLRSDQDWTIGDPNWSVSRIFRDLYRLLVAVGTDRFCGDKRDYVYSLLALVPCSPNTAGLRVDYGLSHTELLLNVLRGQEGKDVVDLGFLLWLKFGLDTAIFRQELANSADVYRSGIRVGLDSPVSATTMGTIDQPSRVSSGLYQNCLHPARLDQECRTYVFSTCHVRPNDWVLSISVDAEEGKLALVCNAPNPACRETTRISCRGVGLKTSEPRLPSWNCDTVNMLSNAQSAMLGIDVEINAQSTSQHWPTYSALIPPVRLEFLIDPNGGFWHWTNKRPQASLVVLG